MSERNNSNDHGGGGGFDPTTPTQSSVMYVGGDTLRGNSAIPLDSSGGGRARAAAGTLGKSHDGKRDRYESLGYPEQGSLSFSHYLGKYDRNAYAKPIVDKPPMKTWGERPEVKDNDDGEGETDFESDVRALFDGEPVRRSLLHRLHNADRMARLGRYSLVWFAVRDGVNDLSEPLEEGALSGLEDVAYIGVFDERHVEAIYDEDDMASDRFGLPVSYEIDPDMNGGEERVQTVHHSRVVHIPGEDTRGSDIYSVPVLRRGWNTLENIEKIRGAGAEGFWRGAYPGIVVSRNPDVQFNDDGKELQEQIERYTHGMRRTMFPQGADVKALSPNIADPSGHMDEEINALSATYDIPQNILTGNELGERATTEDRSTWHETIRARQLNYAEPMILRAVLDWLVSKGAVRPPQGSDELEDESDSGYEVEWPPLSETSEQEQAEIEHTRAQALSQASGGTPTSLLSPPEIRREVFDFPADTGSLLTDEDVEALGSEDDDGGPLEPVPEDDAAQEQFESAQTAQPAPEPAPDGGEDE